MTTIAFIDLPSGEFPNGRPIADGLQTTLKRYRIQVEHRQLDATATADSLVEAVSRPGIVIVHHPIPDHDQALLATKVSPGTAILHLRHTRYPQRTGHHALLPPPAPAQVDHYTMGTVWHSPLSRPAEIALLPPVIRHAANWLVRHRQRRDSLALAEIYARAPLLATAF
jgi:hypothetical protein